MSLRLPGWRSPEGRTKYLAAYDATLSLWPLAYESHDIPSRFGTTHAVVSGPREAPPLLLMHAAGLSATQWFPNAGHFAGRHRVHALDFIGGPGKGIQTQAIESRVDCASWMTDILDALEIEQADLVGSSQGGWLALNLALSVPDRVGNLVLLAPAASILPFKRGMYLMIRVGDHTPAFLAGPSMRGMMGSRYQVNDLFVKQLAASLKYFRYQQRAVFPHAFEDEELRTLGVRTLLLVGEKELIYNPEAAIDRARQLIPDVTAEVIPNAGHLLAMEHAEMVDSRMLDFLGSQRAADGPI